MSAVEDARAEAVRIVTEHPGYEYRKERGGDVCIGCAAKVYGLDGYGRHVAEKTLAASRAVPSDEEVARLLHDARNAPHLRSTHAQRLALIERLATALASRAVPSDRCVNDCAACDEDQPAVPTDHTATTEDAALDSLPYFTFDDDGPAAHEGRRRCHDRDQQGCGPVSSVTSWTEADRG